MKSPLCFWCTKPLLTEAALKLKAAVASWGFKLCAECQRAYEERMKTMPREAGEHAYPLSRRK